MEEWGTYKLSEISSFKTGKLDSNASCEGGKYPFFTCSPETLSINQYAFDQKAILLAGNNAEGNFNVKYYEGKFNAYQRTYVFTANEKKVIPYFLFYALKICLNDFKLMSQGTSTKFLTAKILNSFEVKLPPISIQAKIVNLLRSIDEKVALNNRINHNLEEQAQALYKSWFVDFEPFKDGKFVNSELGMIPVGWQVKNLLEVATLFDSKRKPLSGSERSQMDKIYPYYGATSIMDYVDDYVFDGTYLLMGEDGSVMTEAGFPFLQYVTGKFWPNNHAHVMQGCSGFSTEMLHCALLRKVIKSSVTGAVQAKISQANMKKILFAYPPRDILAVFDNLLQKIYSQIRNAVSQNAALSLVRDNMLPRLMSGQLDC